MPLSETQHAQLQEFFNQSNFAETGGIITDLDGTAIHEYKGRYSIPYSVELGLQKIHELGRPVVINTLRFPLSVIRTFGKEWYSISKVPIPTVLMNGSHLGYIVRSETGTFGFEEIEAFILEKEEIMAVLQIVQNFIAGNILDLLVFYYPRQWQKGEIIWTPVPEKINDVQQKYLSASSVISGNINVLQEELQTQEICMIFLLIDIPQDQLMAYQHTKKSSFFTRKGVDKNFGSAQIAERLNFKLEHSVGAGDSEMDTFLTSVGLAVHVGNPYLKFEGVLPPVKLTGSTELGELFWELAAMQKTIIKDYAQATSAGAGEEEG
jgi:hydroxymethylpyrimidine pyrophosphatase-like HAD family hydrolase